MFSTHVAKQQTTVPKTKNNLAKVAVLLQHDSAFLTLNIYPTIKNTILNKYSEKHWDPYNEWRISVFLLTKAKMWHPECYMAILKSVHMRDKTWV